jgi:integrase/recombinase XerD
MHILKVRANSSLRFHLIDDAGASMPIIDLFTLGLEARGCSPNTIISYLYDLRRFYEFLKEANLTVDDFRPKHSIDFLTFLNAIKPKRRKVALSPALVHQGLSPMTINRILAAVSTFFEYLLLSDYAGIASNPLDASAGNGRVGKARRPGHRLNRLRRIHRIPRPLSDSHVEQLLEVMGRPRDRAMFLLMLQGGLRPGEVLNLHLEDIEYGRRRVTVRYRIDHPKGVRTKSRTERVVDIYEPEALAALSHYVMSERPNNAPTSHLFLVCGAGLRAVEPIGYAALAKLFERRKKEIGLLDPWITPHALRHTHATKLWEGGMRELALQKRMGHASFESTRGYTRVSDAMMIEDYLRALATLKERKSDAATHS